MLWHIAGVIMLVAFVVWLVRGARKYKLNPPIHRTPTATVVYEARRPTVTRVFLGGMFLGIPGALLGFAARKKEHHEASIYEDKQ